MQGERKGERARRGAEQEGEEGWKGRTRKPPGQQITVHGLWILSPSPFPSATHLLVDVAGPVKLIIIKSHSVCRGRPPFVRPRVLLTLI